MQDAKPGRIGPDPLYFALFLVLVLVLMGGAELAKGGLFIAKHEGDALHLVDIVARMAAGERIHRDFMTPIGVLAVLPIVLFVKLGVAAGMAMLLAQILVALLLLPAIWWVCVSRLPRAAAWLAGFYLMTLILALTYGEADSYLSISMHYNRWAWALAYLALLTALLPAGRAGWQRLDGAIIGLALAALALLKITYFVAFLPPVVLSLAMRRAWRVLGVALLAGLAAVLLATAVFGADFWLAYARDLLEVRDSAMRVYPGQPMPILLGGPPYLGVNLALLLAVMLLRQAGRDREGVILLLALPCLIYVVYQNFGNDPQWLVLLVVLLMALRPAAGAVNGWGWNLRAATDMTAVAAMAFALPSFLNLGYSAWRHLWLDAARYEALIPGDAAYADLRTPSWERARVAGTVAIPDAAADAPAAADTAAADTGSDAVRVTLNGEPVQQCELNSDFHDWFVWLADDLRAAGFAGRPVFEADLFNALWLYGDFPRLPGAEPWYYGGAPGIAAADLVLVPNCAISPRAREGKLTAIEAAGYGLRELRRTPFYRLYAKTGAG